MDDDHPTPPLRFRAAEERGRRLGRVLRLAAGVREIDEPLMERIGTALMRADEPGARLAAAMRLPAGDPDRVTMAAFRRALEHPPSATLDGSLDDDAAPPALRAFVAEVAAVPAWVDPALLAEGARVYRTWGRNAADVLLQLSLIGGYRFGGPPDLLVATGGLRGDSARRRLGETQKWTVAISEPGALLPDRHGRRGEGWRLTVHVRAMHALVNAAYRDRWDVARWGLPINQADQAATLGLFDGVVLLGVRALGVRVTRAQAHAVMHLWRYVGWLMGVEEQWLTDDERTRHRLNYHLLLAQDDVTPAGGELARDLVEMLRGLPAGEWRRERTLSMLSAFLGRQSMRDLGLPWRPPWAHAGLWPLNTARHRVLGRLPGGPARLERAGAAVARRTLADYFGDDEPAVAPLPV